MPTKKEAVELESKVRRDIEKRTIIDRGIEHALTTYLHGEAKSLKGYKALLSIGWAVIPFVEGKTFKQAGQVASTMKNDMLAQGLKPATINRRLALLRRVCNLAFDWGWIEENISRRIKLLPGEEERHYYLTVEEVDQFAKAMPLSGDLVRVLAYTGLRHGELFRLEPEWITEDFIILSNETKTGKPRLIPIPDQVKDIIRALPLPLTKSHAYQLRTEWEAARKELGMDHLRIHDLRHTYASLLAQAGATLHLIGKAMGHSTPVMTNRYAHLVSDNLKDLANRFKAMG
ncbi:MAG: site-specific integrase [Candidatus Thiodiazotropha sp. (ex Troendleina suluensis)]|nr:site-specific integrase [Candidatus Thiodiazotropha sp. (ex Troendleina suluensis)]